jgi:uncharacterized membrane protein
MADVLKIARGLGLTGLIVTYALLVHQVNAAGEASILGAMLVLAPLCLIAAGLIATAMAGNAASKIAGAAIFCLWLLAMYLLWPWVMQHTAPLFWLQDIGLMLLLLLMFGRTLLPGQQPLCVHFAEMIHGGALTSAHARYARQVTVAWVIFFAAIITISSLLFFLAPLAIWSIFVNFLTLPLVALMFIAEFMLRRRLLVGVPSGHILDAVRAYLQHAARSR